MDVWNFWDINWGPDEAKGDLLLKDYFVPVPEYDKVIRGEYRYILGRKGSGKTAICEKIRMDAEEDPLCFSSSLSLRNFPLNYVRDLRNKSYRDKSQFVPVWSFLIAVELSKLVLRDNGSGPYEHVEELRCFLKENAFMNNMGFVETIQSLQKHQAKVKVAPNWISYDRSHEESQTASITIHFHQITTTLIHKLKLIHSESKYYLFMDELDEGYRAGDSGLRLILLALLRAVEDISIEFRNSQLLAFPVVALRSDIFDRLEDNDLNKLDDHILRIRWRSSKVRDHYLKDIPNARITSSLHKLAGSDPWDKVVDDKGRHLPSNVRSCWSYIANCTFERPRDIIKFMKLCQKQEGHGKLTFPIIQRAERAYSDWFYNELRDEIHTYLPIWKEALSCIAHLGIGSINSADFIDALKKNKKISKWLEDNNKDVEEINEYLFEFGIIGNLEDKRWLFKYKDDDLTWNPSMKIIVHYGLRRKLNLSRASSTDGPRRSSRKRLEK